MQQASPILHQDFPSGDQHSQIYEILARLSSRHSSKIRYYYTPDGTASRSSRNGPTCVSYGFSTKRMAEHDFYWCAELDKWRVSLTDV